METLVKKRVREYYWEKDLNCAVTTLCIMAEHFGVSIGDQVFDAAAGMHGAGGYRAQCGLVEGCLMFIGIIGRQRGMAEGEIVAFCRETARNFETRFSSLVCRALRPQGFAPDNPPHLCEGLTVDAILHNMEAIAAWLDTFREEEKRE